MRKNLAAIEAMAERAENLGGENALKGALRATLDSLRQMQKYDNLAFELSPPPLLTTGLLELARRGKSEGAMKL